MYYGPPMQPYPPRRSPAIIILGVILVVAVLLILVVALVVISGNDNSPEGVFREYIGAVDDGDVQSVYENSAEKFYMTYEDFEAGYYYGPADLFTMDINSTAMVLPANMTLWENWTATLIAESINLLISPNVVDHFCIVEYSITIEMTGYPTETEEGYVTMVEIDGKWYVGTEF